MDKLSEFKVITDTAESYNEHEASEFEVLLDDADREDEPSSEDVVRYGGSKLSLGEPTKGRI